MAKIALISFILFLIPNYVFANPYVRLFMVVRYRYDSLTSGCLEALNYICIGQLGWF